MNSQERSVVVGPDAMAAAHFVFVPLMAMGHLIPAVDCALLLAARGAHASILVTLNGAARISPTIHRAQQAGLPVRLIDIPLDCAEAGLPDGASDMDRITDDVLMANYFRSFALLRGPLERHLRAHTPYPTCIVSDFCHPWTMELAADLKAPRLTFFSMCAFCLLCNLNVQRHNAFDGIADHNQKVVVPGLPQRIEMTRGQAPGNFFRVFPGWDKFADEVDRAQLEADGIVMNVFQELEPDYLAGYEAAMGKKAWTIGPVSLYHEQTDTAEAMAVRGDNSAIDAADCLNWLDSKKPKSVIYVSFGTHAYAEPKQFMELGLGLEASKLPFIWVIKKLELYDETVHSFLRELEERVGGRGLVIRGWAPQVLILSHPAVGGFVTHCGWNSVLEAVSHGVPMVTWPHFADQFLNEKLVVEVARIGASIGVEEPLMFTVEKKVIVVGREEVEKAVRRVMDGVEAEDMRKRAEALREKARAAMQEGGSSHANLRDLIHHFSV